MPSRGFSEKEYYRAFFEDAPVPIAYVERDGSFLAVNREWCEITGYSEAELLDRDFQSITHPDDLTSDVEMVEKMLADPDARGYPMVKRYIRKTGESVWVSLHVRPVWVEEAFRFFVSWAIPLPNHGRFKVESEGRDIHVRPNLEPPHLAKDFAIWTVEHWKVTGPLFGLMAIALTKIVIMIWEILKATGVEIL